EARVLAEHVLGVAALREELDRLAVLADGADRAGPRFGCPELLGQHRVENLLGRQRLGETLADALKPIRAIRGILEGFRRQNVALRFKLHLDPPGRRPDCTCGLPRIGIVSRSPRIGILAVQGNVREHAAVLRRLGAEPVEVRKPEQLADLDGLIIPGGESTAIARLVRLYGLEEAIRGFERPIFGTCAGMILLDRRHLGLLDLEVSRNAYGRQVASFEADLELSGEDEPLHGVFIRAPRVLDAGPGVEVLAELN